MKTTATRTWIGALMLGVGLTLGSLTQESAAQETTTLAEPAAEAPAAPALPTDTPLATDVPPATTDAPADAAAAPPTMEELAQRVADMEAYVTNGAPSAADKGGKLSGVPGPGHNAWLMTSAALVLFMTLPGLALFYGGLVRRKNVLSVMAQCLGCAGLVTVLWWAVGYSLVFGKSFESGFLGGSEFFFLKGVTSAPNTDYSAWVSQNVFAMFQMMFAIITPALIVGAIAERMKYISIMLFIAIWMFAVYFPMAHMVWGATGYMNGVWNAGATIKAIDFAGGTVVHMTSGWSALILCMMLGKRMGFGKEKMAPHSMVLCMIGTGMLWVGWYGFNAGSAGSADGVASNAFMTTTLAAATAGFIWAAVEWMHKGHPSILGFCSGIVAGLVVITPACGFVNATGAMIIGFLAAIIPYIFVVFVKNAVGYDDALDTFGVHAVGGTLGAVLTGILATTEVNSALSINLSTVVGNGLLMEQLKAVGLTLVISIVGTIVIAFLVKMIVGLRPSPEEESAGLDLTDHNEAGYID